MWSDLILGPSFKVKRGYKSLIILLGGLQCEVNLLKIMDLVSSDVVIFDLGLLLQG